MSNNLKNLVKQILDENTSVQTELFYSRPSSEFEDLIKYTNGITLEYQDSFGGEGQGDQYWSVYKFTKNDKSVYVKFYGWYASYVGSEYMDYSFVEPAQKTITVYK